MMEVVTNTKGNNLDTTSWSPFHHLESFIERISSPSFLVRQQVSVEFYSQTSHHTDHQVYTFGKSFVWCCHEGSNPGPAAYKAAALPSEL